MYAFNRQSPNMFDTGSTLNSNGERGSGRHSLIAANSDLAIALEKFKKAFHEKRIGAGSGMAARETP